MEVALPTCHICQGQMSRGLYEAAQWTCMRCWGGWLAGTPEPVTHEHQSGGKLSWDFDDGSQAPQDKTVYVGGFDL